MKIIGKTVGISVLTGACIGAILALVFALLGRPQSELGRETTLWQSLLAPLLFGSAIALPPALVGGALAGILLWRQRLPASVWVWVVRGIGVGSMVGALGAGAAPVLLMGALQSAGAGSIMVATFSLFGALGGILAGAVVAVWCYRAQRSIIPIVRSSEPTAA
jgi:hypothetical protein